MSQARNRHEAGSKQSLHVGFLLGLLFGLEDEGDMFLRNARLLSTRYTALYLFGEAFDSPVQRYYIYFPI
jgi:hypothetical protein